MISDFNATDILSRLRGGLQQQQQVEHQPMNTISTVERTPGKPPDKEKSTSTPGSVASEQRHPEGRAVLAALKQEVRRLAGELAAVRDENAGLRGDLQAAHDKFAQYKLKTDDLVTKLRGKLAVVTSAQSQGPGVGQGGGSLAGKLYPPPHHIHPHHIHANRAGQHWRGSPSDPASEMKEGPVEGFRDPTFSELMRRASANLPSSSSAGRRTPAGPDRAAVALTQSQPSPVLLGSGLGLGLGQGDPAFAGYLSPAAAAPVYSSAGAGGRVAAPVEGIFYLPPGGVAPVQPYSELDGRGSGQGARYQAAYVNPGSNSEEAAAPSPSPSPVAPSSSSSSSSSSSQYPRAAAALSGDGSAPAMAAQQQQRPNKAAGIGSGRDGSNPNPNPISTRASISSNASTGNPVGIVTGNGNGNGSGIGIVGATTAPSSSSSSSSSLGRPLPPPPGPTQTQTQTQQMQMVMASGTAAVPPPPAPSSAPTAAAPGEKRTKKVLLRERDKKGVGHGPGHGGAEEGDARFRDDEDDALPVINIDLRAAN